MMNTYLSCNKFLINFDEAFKEVSRTRALLIENFLADAVAQEMFPAGYVLCNLL